MDRTTVLLLFGGESPEHEVSIASARNVFAALDDQKFDVKLGYIDKHGKWWLLPALEGEMSTHGHPQLVPVLGTGQLTTLPELVTLHPDVIFPVLHGENGEDGTVQGLAQLLHIPIVGSGVTASAVAMDKVLTKQLLTQVGVPVVPYEVHFSGDPLPHFNQIVTRLGSPLFVKPATLGSSVGVSKVHDEEAFVRALEEAHTYASKVLIEQGIVGQELEVAVLGKQGAVDVSGVGEIKTQGDFYSYRAKYDPGSTSEIIIPAAIPDDIAEEIRLYAQKTFSALGCSGHSRVDFFYATDGAVYVNEINTLPGFTNISMYPKLWQQRGIHYPVLVERLINLALEK